MNRREYVYKCHRAAGPVTIDGLLDEADWQASRAVQLVDLFGNPPLQPTTVRAMSSGDILYIGFEVWDKEIWATMTERDDKVWTEEAVEFFISPPHLYPRAYYEFQISPGNAVRDIAVTWGSDGQKSLNADWNCHGLETAVHLEERGEWKVWTCEAALPMSSLSGGVYSAREDGRDWMINFFRIDRKPRLEYSCWSPTFQPNFHLPERFGRLLL